MEKCLLAMLEEISDRNRFCPSEEAERVPKFSINSAAESLFAFSYKHANTHTRQKKKPIFNSYTNPIDHRNRVRVKKLTLRNPLLKASVISRASSQPLLASSRGKRPIAYMLQGHSACVCPLSSIAFTTTESIHTTNKAMILLVRSKASRGSNHYQTAFPERCWWPLSTTFALFLLFLCSTIPVEVTIRACAFTLNHNIPSSRANGCQRMEESTLSVQN